MRVTRVFVGEPLATDADLFLPEAAANHVARVLRLREGAAIVAFDGNGSEYRCEILAVTGDRVQVRVGAKTAGLAESPLRITLVQAVSRSDRMVRLDDKQAAKKLRHWQAIVAGACEQSGRSVVPEVRAPIELGVYLANAPREGQRFVLSPTGPASLAGLTSVGPRAELLIGPEGGLDDAELERAASAGFTPVRLGPRVLRTETAGIVALTVLQALWGDLQ
jgi:16S rRNA (uracil1498-N3)-methyltransferase